MVRTMSRASPKSKASPEPKQKSPTCRRRTVMRRLGVFSLALVAILVVVTINAHAQSMMTHHVRDLNRNGRVQAMGHLPLSQTMTLNIVLPMRDQAGLKNLLSEIYNP